MKSAKVLRDDLYISLDRIINHAKTIEKRLPRITINAKQYEVFKDFNSPDSEAFYHYRGVLISGSSCVR